MNYGPGGGSDPVAVPRPPMNPPRQKNPIVNDPTAQNPNIRRGYICSVSPTPVSGVAANPTSCSVILDDRGATPRAGFTLPAGTGPLYQSGLASITLKNGTTGPPPGPWYSNPSTLTGGSWVIVDTQSMSVLQILQGTAQALPSALGLVNSHVHTGGADSSGNPMPSTIDVGHLSPNPSPSTAPVLSGAAPTFTYSNVGASAFDLSFSITLTTTNPGWLYGLNLYAVNHGAGAPNQYSSAWSTVSPATPSGTYTNVNLLGLTAGISGGWDIYVSFLDNSGGVSAPLLLGTTLSNPQSVGGSLLPSVPSAFAFSGTESGEAYSAALSGAATVTFNASLTVTNFGTGTSLLNTWCDHASIMLAPTGSSHFFEATQVPAHSLSTNTSPVSLGSVSAGGLGAGSAYDVKYRLVSINGDYIDSAVVFKTAAQNVPNVNQVSDSGMAHAHFDSTGNAAQGFYWNLVVGTSKNTSSTNFAITQANGSGPYGGNHLVVRAAESGVNCYAVSEPITISATGITMALSGYIDASTCSGLNQPFIAVYNWTGKKFGDTIGTATQLFKISQGVGSASTGVIAPQTFTVPLIASQVAIVLHSNATTIASGVLAMAAPQLEYGTGSGYMVTDGLTQYGTPTVGAGPTPASTPAYTF